ncbi:unnamed protein product [Meloidogyne enterolobii]|uniref:Uncharacterized protein n=1 Tax=Meloidogyne enterolobii TaxID=390850 RepID=A0ACB1AQX5_MELEN
MISKGRGAYDRKFSKTQDREAPKKGLRTQDQKTSSLENNNDRQQQQRRKRSNEPSTRTTASSSNKEKQRKSVNQSGKQDIEECLKQLTRENEIQKSKLEEQIRLNSVRK